MSETEKKVCYKHKEESKGLRSCNNCNTIFCGHCIAEEHDTKGVIREITAPYCPKCKSQNIVYLPD